MLAAGYGGAGGIGDVAQNALLGGERKRECDQKRESESKHGITSSTILQEIDYGTPPGLKYKRTPPWRGNRFPESAAPSGR